MLLFFLIIIIHLTRLPTTTYDPPRYALDVRATHSNVSGVVTHFVTAFGLSAPLGLRARDLFPAPDLG